MKSILFLVGILLAGIEVRAQIEFQLENQRVNQVISENTTALAIDNLGYLWIGTSNGVLRYDGHTLNTYQNEGKDGDALNGNFVYDILCRSDTSVWISTYGGGISMYRYQTNDFKTILNTNDGRSIQENRVIGMHTLSPDSILVHYRGISYHEGGFSILNNQGQLVDHYLEQVDLKDTLDFRFYDVLLHHDELWIPSEKLFCINRYTINYRIMDYPSTLKKWMHIKAIHALNDSTILLGSSHGLYSYSLKHDSWTEMLGNTIVHEIQENQKHIYILTLSSVYRIDKTDGKISHFLEIEDANNAKRVKFNVMALDDKHLWIGHSHGLHRFNLDEKTVSTRKLEPVNGEYLRCIIRLGKSLKGKDLYVDYNGHILEEVIKNKVRILAKVGRHVHGTIFNYQRPGQYLFATNDGISLYDVQTDRTNDYIENTALETFLADEPIWSLYYEKNKQVLWIGTRTKGLVKYDIKNDSYINFRHDPDNPASLIFDRYLFKIIPGLDGNLWISTDNGISVIDPRTDTFVVYPSIMDKLENYIVHHLIAGDRYMWIGTRDHGLYRYDIQNDLVKNYTIRQGLPFTGANRVIFENGIVFFSTKKGVCTLEEATDKIKCFDQTNGIDHDDLYHCKLNLEDEYLLISGGISNNIYQIPRYSFTSEIVLNPILIESIRTNTADSTFNYHFPQDKINLSAAENNLQIHFTNIDFNQRKINYRYRLKGYDTRWTETNLRRFANYSHLPGGNYTFQLQSALAGRNWEHEHQLKISIQKYWYRTLWFYALCAALILGIIGLLLKISFDKINLKESYQLKLKDAELKALRAQMNPHFLFNSLNSIKSFIIENDRRNASTYLNKFSKLVRMILNHSKSDTITIAEELQAIQLYIDMERLRFDSFEYVSEIDEALEVEELYIPPMIIQPYLENAIWHGLQHKQSGKGILKLRCKLIDENNLEVQITDNGVGRKAAASLKSKSALENKSLGMNITKERLAHNATRAASESITIIDLYEGTKPIGTKIILIIPVTKSDTYER